MTGFEVLAAVRNGPRAWVLLAVEPHEGCAYATPYVGNKGYPDLTLARNGVVLFAECKLDKEKPSRDQQAWLDALNGEGSGRAVVWKPKFWDDILRILA